MSIKLSSLNLWLAWLQKIRPTSVESVKTGAQGWGSWQIRQQQNCNMYKSCTWTVHKRKLHCIFEAGMQHWPNLLLLKSNSTKQRESKAWLTWQLSLLGFPPSPSLSRHLQAGARCRKAGPARQEDKCIPLLPKSWTEAPGRRQGRREKGSPPRSLQTLANSTLTKRKPQSLWVSVSYWKTMTGLDDS